MNHRISEASSVFLLRDLIVALQYDQLLHEKHQNFEA